jgi:hypothetical protein
MDLSKFTLYDSALKKAMIFFKSRLQKIIKEK